MGMSRPRPGRIPPLNSLRAFEVAARHLSFTRAADELCVTQGAISRSVKALENYLGEPLFRRTARGLALTERSEPFARRLTEGYSLLSEATDSFLGVTASPVLTVRTYTSFMIGFLMPNLPEFQVAHPQIKVRLVSLTDRTNLAREQVDVRIRYGRGQWKDVSSTLLFHDRLRPVCSPKLLDPAKRPYPIEIIRDHQLLHQHLRLGDWPDWLSKVGGDDIQPKSEVVFDESSLVYQGAIDGVGIAMAQKAFFQREIADGRLVEPFDEELTRDLGYYLTVPNNRRDCEHVRLFRKWLLETIQEAGLTDAAQIPQRGVKLPEAMAGLVGRVHPGGAPGNFHAS